MGRPKLEISDRDITQIEISAGLGLSQERIALIVGVAKGTLRRWLKHPQVQAAYERGRVKGELAVNRSFYEQAINGNLGEIVLWHKLVCGYRENPTQQVESEQREES